MSSEAIARFPHVWVANDTLPEIVLVFEGENLTGFTIELFVRRPDNTLLVKAAQFIDATQGKFKFVWVDGDLQVGLGQLAEIRFTLASNVEHTELLIIDVREAV